MNIDSDDDEVFVGLGNLDTHISLLQLELISGPEPYKVLAIHFIHKLVEATTSGWLDKNIATSAMKLLETFVDNDKKISFIRFKRDNSSIIVMFHQYECSDPRVFPVRCALCHKGHENAYIKLSPDDDSGEMKEYLTKVLVSMNEDNIDLGQYLSVSPSHLNSDINFNN